MSTRIDPRPPPRQLASSARTVAAPPTARARSTAASARTNAFSGNRLSSLSEPSVLVSHGERQQRDKEVEMLRRGSAPAAMSAATAVAGGRGGLASSSKPGSSRRAAPSSGNAASAALVDELREKQQANRELLQDFFEKSEPKTADGAVGGGPDDRVHMHTLEYLILNGCAPKRSRQPETARRNKADGNYDVDQKPLELGASRQVDADALQGTPGALTLSDGSNRQLVREGPERFISSASSTIAPASGGPAAEPLHASMSCNADYDNTLINKVIGMHHKRRAEASTSTLRSHKPPGDTKQQAMADALDRIGMPIQSTFFMDSVIDVTKSSTVNGSSRPGSTANAASRGPASATSHSSAPKRTKVPRRHWVLREGPIRELNMSEEEAESAYNRDERLFKRLVFPSRDDPSRRPEVFFLAQTLDLMCAEINGFDTLFDADLAYAVQADPAKEGSTSAEERRDAAMGSFAAASTAYTATGGEFLKVIDCALSEVARQVAPSCVERSALLDCIRMIACDFAGTCLSVVDHCKSVALAASEESSAAERALNDKSDQIEELSDLVLRLQEQVAAKQDELEDAESTIERLRRDLHQLEVENDLHQKAGAERDDARSKLAAAAEKMIQASVQAEYQKSGGELSATEQELYQHTLRFLGSLNEAVSATDNACGPFYDKSLFANPSLNASVARNKWIDIARSVGKHEVLVEKREALIRKAEGMGRGGVTASASSFKSGRVASPTARIERKGEELIDPRTGLPIAVTMDVDGQDQLAQSMEGAELRQSDPNDESFTKSGQFDTEAFLNPKLVLPPRYGVTSTDLCRLFTDTQATVSEIAMRLRALSDSEALKRLTEPPMLPPEDPRTPCTLCGRTDWQGAQRKRRNEAVNRVSEAAKEKEKTLAGVIKKQAKSLESAQKQIVKLQNTQKEMEGRMMEMTMSHAMNTSRQRRSVTLSGDSEGASPGSPLSPGFRGPGTPKPSDAVVPKFEDSARSTEGQLGAEQQSIAERRGTVAPLLPPGTKQKESEEKPQEPAVPDASPIVEFAMFNPVGTSSDNDNDELAPKESFGASAAPAPSDPQEATMKMSTTSTASCASVDSPRRRGRRTPPLMLNLIINCHCRTKKKEKSKSDGKPGRAALAVQDFGSSLRDPLDGSVTDLNDSNLPSGNVSLSGSFTSFQRSVSKLDFEASISGSFVGQSKNPAPPAALTGSASSNIRTSFSHDGRSSVTNPRSSSVTLASNKGESMSFDDLRLKSGSSAGAVMPIEWASTAERIRELAGDGKDKNNDADSESSKKEPSGEKPAEGQHAFATEEQRFVMARLEELVASTGTVVGPQWKVKPLRWTLRIVAQFYALKLEEDLVLTYAKKPINSCNEYLTIFLRQMFGTPALVRSNALHLVVALHTAFHQGRDPRLTLFARFLVGMYSTKTLNFFLRLGRVVSEAAVGPEYDESTAAVDDHPTVTCSLSIMRILFVVEAVMPTRPYRKALLDLCWSLAEPVADDEEYRVAMIRGVHHGTVAPVKLIPKSWTDAEIATSRMVLSRARFLAIATHFEAFHQGEGYKSMEDQMVIQTPEAS